MEQELSKKELDERVAILRRLRTLLEQQRAKFQEYLSVLENQESKISEEDADSIIAHSELEEQIVSGIGSLQKVIVPMQKLCQTSNAASYNPAECKPVADIQNDLVKLQAQVLKQNERNQALLRTHITDIKRQIVEFKNPYRNIKSIYAERGAVGSLVHIDA
ncbi:MAG: flagellar biosynthesis protein FlgN [Treponema sp.]